MKSVLETYVIPFSKLAAGTHKFQFEVESNFFSCFENALIDNGKFEIQIVFDKKYDHSRMSIIVDGNTLTNCDRCTAEINLPVNGTFDYLLKHLERKDSGKEEEIIFIHQNTYTVNVSKNIYDCICLCIPYTRVYDCTAQSPIPCNSEVLNGLDINSAIKNNDNSPWDELKNIVFD